MFVINRIGGWPNLLVSAILFIGVALFFWGDFGAWGPDSSTSWSYAVYWNRFAIMSTLFYTLVYYVISTAQHHKNNPLFLWFWLLSFVWLALFGVCGWYYVMEAIHKSASFGSTWVASTLDSWAPLLLGIVLLLTDYVMLRLYRSQNVREQILVEEILYAIDIPIAFSAFIIKAMMQITLLPYVFHGQFLNGNAAYSFIAGVHTFQLVAFNVVFFVLLVRFNAAAE